MKMYFNGTHLTLPKLGVSKRIDKNTSQFNFIHNHKNDLEKEIGVLSGMLHGFPPPVITDALAGCGFSGRIFQQIWPESSLILNDLDVNCYHILKNNFPEASVYNDYAENLTYPEGGFVFLDFNLFSLKKLRSYMDILDKAFKSRPKELIMTDSASYGFKFREKFLRSYGISNYWDYYYLLRQTVYETWGYYINQIKIFGNAALLRINDIEMDLQIGKEFDRIQINKNKGLFNE